MVHGTGSFGGGGGFSGGGGGGFTTTIMAHNYSHSYRRHGHGDGCDCSWICVCFCCRGQSFQVRILTLWTWLIAIVLTASLVTLFHVNKAQKVDATVTDMRKVPQTVSDSFCSGATNTSYDSSFTAFLIDGEPVVSGNDVQNVTFRKNTNIAYNNYEYWGFYLLKNSIIEISACPDSVLDFMIVRGEESFNRFKNEDCTYSCSVFYKSSSCNFNRPDRFHYNVPKDDEYYLIYANSRYILPFPINVAVNFTLEKRIYDLQNSVVECSNSQGSPSCTLPFSSLHSHPSIVLNVTSSSDLEGDSVIKVACISKDWVYVMLFFILPVVVGGLGTLLIVKKYRKKPDSNRAMTSTQSSAPFAPLPPVLEQSQSVDSGRHGLGYGTLMAPPKYEETTGKPPTYEEATRK